MSNQNETEFMVDAQGRRVPVEIVKPIDKIRNQTVIKVFARAFMLRQAIMDFKKDSMDDILTFLEISAEQYGKKYGGKKGNVTLISFDGRYKILIAIDESIVFDERLQVAKKIIDECIVRWSEGSRVEIRALVNDAFYVDKQGKINTQRVLGLRRLDIQDAQWQLAMQAISDSITVSDSKQYLRVYERDAHGEYQALALDPTKI